MLVLPGVPKYAGGRPPKFDIVEEQIEAIALLDNFSPHLSMPTDSRVENWPQTTTSSWRRAVLRGPHT